MSNNLSVKITADIVDLQTKFGIARAEANALGAEFRKLSAAAALGSLDAVGSAALSRVAEDMLVAKQRAADLASQMEKTRVSTGGVGGALEEIRGKLSTAFQFTGLAAAAAAIAGIGAKLVELGSRAAEIQTTADVLGVTAEQYQAMSAAADVAGISSEAVVRVSERLVGLLQKARDGSGAAAEKLKALGITNQEIESSTFGVNDALGVLHARLTTASTAQTEQNRLLAEFGPRGALAIEVLKRYGGSQEEVAARIRELNGLSAAQVKSTAAVYASYKEFGTYLANTFTKVLDATTEGVSRAADVVLAAPAKSPALQATIEVPTVAPRVRADAAAANDALQTVSVTAHRVTLEDLEAIRDSMAAYKSGSAERLALVKQLAAEAKEFYPSDQADKYRAILRELSAEERAFAEEQVRASQRAAAEFERSWTDLRSTIEKGIELDRKAQAEKRGIARADAESEIAINRMRLQTQLNDLEGDLTAHRINADQKYQIAQTLTRELAKLDLEQLDLELSVLKPGTAEYERAADKKKEIEAKLQQDLSAEKRKYVSETEIAARQEVTVWKRAVDEIESAESTLVGDLISRRKSLGQSLLSISAQFTQQEIANDLKAMTTRLLLSNTEQAQQKALEQGGFLYHLLMQSRTTAATTAAQTAQTSAVVAGNTARLSADSTAAAVGKAQQSAVQGPSIMADAAKAFSGTYASVASIPYVGWILAPAAAAAAFAAVAAYEGLASLDVGTTYVPKTGLYQLHEGEAVAPVPFARGLREGGGALAAALAGGGDAAGFSEHHNYNGNVRISTLDARGVDRMMRTPGNRRALANAVRQHIARGGR